MGSQTLSMQPHVEPAACNNLCFLTWNEMKPAKAISAKAISAKAI